LSSAWLDPDLSRRAAAYLEEAFGIPAETWADHVFLSRGEYVHVLARSAAGACDAFQWVAAGLRILKVAGGGRFKPTSGGVQAFGRWATKRVRDLTDPDLRALLAGQTIADAGREDGPVILRWRGIPLGMGFVRGDRLVSQLPRGVTEHLRVRPTVAEVGRARQ